MLTPNPEKESRQDAPGAKRIYQGQGIAPGKVRGIAYKVKDLSNSDYLDHLSGEHILVCGRDQDNAQWKRDWGSLFMIVRGLVTVSGAQLHHATQIARECGVVFINLPDEELDHIPNGASIEIDGQAGTLTIL